jgi:hypothetical protein
MSAVLLAAHDHLAGLGPVGWAILGAAVLASLWVIWRAVHLTLHPGEEEPDHIKRSILADEAAAPRRDRP